MVLFIGLIFITDSITQLSAIGMESIVVEADDAIGVPVIFSNYFYMFQAVNQF